MITPQDFTRIGNDVNGNPRYVCHFLNLLKTEEPYSSDILLAYKLATKRANKLGGKKYDTKSYGGGIVFQSYNLGDLCKRINESLK